MSNASAAPFQPEVLCQVPAVCVSGDGGRNREAADEAGPRTDRESNLPPRFRRVQAAVYRESHSAAPLISAAHRMRSPLPSSHVSRSDSGANLGQSSRPLGDVSWYSTDSEPGIKISNPIDATTALTIRELAKIKQLVHNAVLRSPVRNVFGLPKAPVAVAVSSEDVYVDRTSVGQVSFDIPWEHCSHQRDVPSSTESNDPREDGNDGYASVLVSSAKGGLFADVTPVRRAISEGGSPLGNPHEGPLVLSEATVGELYIPAPSVHSNPQPSVGPVYSQYGASFDGGDGPQNDTRDWDDRGLDRLKAGDEVTSTFTSIGTLITTEGNGDGEWVQGHKDKSLNDVGSLHMSPRLGSSGYLYGGDGSGIMSQSLAEDVRTEMSIKRTIELVTDQDLDEAERSREVSRLMRKLSQLELEVKRLSEEIVGLHVIIAGVLRILGLHNLISGNGSDL